VVQVLDGSNTHGQPHVFCVYVEKEAGQFKAALKNAFLSRERNTPIDQMVNTVQYGDVFEIRYAKNEFFAKSTRAFCKERRLKDSNFEDLFLYQDIKSRGGASCEIDLGGEVPRIMETDRRECCLGLKIREDDWTICQTGDCQTPTRKLARFLTKECAGNYPLTAGFSQIDSAQDDPYESEFEDNSEVGEWNGWGFFSILPQVTEQSFRFYEV